MASVNVSNGATGSPSTNLSPDPEEESLTQLIESELALRIAAAHGPKETPPDELLVQADFFSTTQYESPSDEVPPTGDPFDPFSTTVEESPTFTGFSADELKDFNQGPFCGDILSPTLEPLKTCIKDSIISANVSLLSELDPVKSPSPPAVNKMIDLELSLGETPVVDPILQTIDVSPSPPLLEEDLVSVDPINQTIDLSPTPPPDNKTNMMFNESPTDLLLTPSPPLADEQVTDNNELQVIDEPIFRQNLAENQPDDLKDNKTDDLKDNKTDDLEENEPEPVNKLDLGQNETDVVQNGTDLGQNGTDLGQNGTDLGQNGTDLVQNGTDLGQNGTDLGQNESFLGDTEPEPVNEADCDVVNESEFTSEAYFEEPVEEEEAVYEDVPAPDIIDHVVEPSQVLDDPIYQTYDLSPSPPVENGERHSPNVEIVISEPAASGEHFTPMSLEIDGFETWTVAGTEEEEEEAPPLQKSLLPERPTTLPHVDTTTNNVVDGEEVISPSSEEPSTPSAESSPTKKKASKKTKSSGEGKVKKSKKTKKCEEKENISVAGLPPPDLLHEIRSLRTDTEPVMEQDDTPVKSLASPITLVSREELGNVSVKNLSMKFVRGPKATQLRTDMDELEGVSFKALLEMYVTEANKEYNGRIDKRPSNETVAVSINSLRRSFGDLSTLSDANTNGDRSISPGSTDAPVSPMFRKAYGTLPLPKSPKHTDKSEDTRPCKSPVCDMRARSYSDLTVRENNKEPIITGVSVKALLASYCSVAQLKEETRSTKSSSNVSSPSSPLPQSRSSFSKFDALSRKSGVLHVRSSDAAKAQQHFSQGGGGGGGDPTAPQHCRACGTQVFQMEQVKAEKSVWHKNCFRCKECNKQLTVDSYSSNEGVLYCKPHFKDLFKPKAVAIDEPALLRPRRLEMIIRENQPEELPPDVVRASDKPDLGLEELTSLNVKSRYQAFERTEESTNDIERCSNVNVKRSPSILSKLAKFQAKGMDVGVSDDALNGIPVETSSEEEEEESEEELEDGEERVIKARVKKERPMSFGKMDDVRSMWATGQAQRREELREERKEEVQKLRSRLFMGKCVKVKEMYEQAVQESAGTKTSSQQRASEVRSDMARSIKERFEKGEPLLSDSEENEEQDNNKKSRQEDLSVFEAGISKKSRSMFLELDSAAKSQQQSPHTPRSPISKPEPRRIAKEWLSHESPSQEVVRATDKVEEVEVKTADISTRFKFFEGYREPEKQRKQFRITPPRDGQVKESSPDRPLYRDPDVVRAEDHVAEEELVRSQTASRMLNLFRQMEEKAGKEDVPEGPKPLKRFTPPPDYKKGDSGASSDEDDSEDEESGEDEQSDEETRGQSGVIRAADRMEDDFLKQAQSTNAARSKALKAKFEQWDSSKPVNGQRRENGQEEEYEEEDVKEGRESLESTSSLRARFESMGAPPNQGTLDRDRPKVNRFVVATVSDECRACEQRLYPMDRLEAGGFLYHRKCFRCKQCNCSLRLESFTVNQGSLYCLPHFKQLFIARGNYQEGFGSSAPTPPASVASADKPVSD